MARVTILGAGVVGIGWAAIFGANGHEVRVWDPTEGFGERLARKLDLLTARIPTLVPTGTIRAASSIDDASAGAALIQENAPEQAALKRTLFATSAAAAPPDAIFASSTSSLTWPELFEGCAFAQRCITAHPFNPVYLMPLVELYGIDDTVIDRARTLYESIGKRTVRLNQPAVGHIANRLAAALWREAVHMVDAGIADVAAIDKALVDGPGLRWAVNGAHLSYHLGGGDGGLPAYLERLGASQERRWATLGTPSLSPQLRARLVEGVLDEANGRGVAELERARDNALQALMAAR